MPWDCWLKESIMNKIKQYLFYKDGEFSWWKSIQNILLIYVVLYLIGLYDDSSVSKFSFDFQGSAIGIILASILCYSLIIIICILDTFRFENTILKTLIKLFKFTSFIVILFCYGLVVNICENPICFLNPFVFPVVVLAFILIFNRTKYFSQFFVVLFLIPASVIITDDIIQCIKIRDFYSTCKQMEQKEEYNPIFLKSEFFSEKNKNGKKTLIPNVIQGKWPLFRAEYASNVQDIGWCSQDKNFKIISAINDGAVIICKESDGNKITVKQILKNNRINDIAQISSLKVFWSYSWLSHLLNLTHVAYVCDYPNRKYWNSNVVPYENYIKPQSLLNTK